MVHAPRGLLILAGLAALWWPSGGFGQTAPPPSSLPILGGDEGGGETIPIPPRPLEAPAPPPPPPSPGLPTALPPPSPPPDAGWPPQETGVLGPAGQWDGWFATLEVGLINPHIDSHLNSGSNIKAPFLTPSTPTGSVQTPVPPGSNANVIDIFGSAITLPVAPLDWTGAPRVRLGYRFADGAGDVRLDWRMAASQGTDTIPNFDAAGEGVLKRRLNVQYASLTYGASDFFTNAPQLNRNWAVRFGLSAADVFFDSQARGQQILEQRASSDFAGVGLTVGFQFHKAIARTRFSLYGELDATGLAGWTRQHFGETVAADGGPLSASADLKLQSNGIAIFGTEGGFSYAPWDDRSWRFTFGYQWQRWWWVGATSDSNAALTLQGLFWRAEWRY